MSALKKQKNFVRFILSSPLKKQVKVLLHNLTPGQNLALREIIHNVGRFFPRRYKRLQKKIKKPLSAHFLKRYWENLWDFLKQHKEFILKALDEEISADSA